MSRRGGPRGARLPLPVAIAGGVAIACVALPLLGLLAKVPWPRLGALLAGTQALDALGVTVRTAAVALLLDLLLGVPLGALLARRWPGVRVARALVLLPLAMPPVVGGLALLATLGRRGLLGPVVGGALAFTPAAVVLAQCFVSLPFLVVTVESALRSREPGLEDAAATLGAGPWATWWGVTLPSVRPAVVRGGGLALARILGEFGATLTFAGSLQGTTRTLPLEIYLGREVSTDTALALGVVLLAAAALVVVPVSLARWPRRRRRALPEPAAGPLPAPLAVRVAGAVPARGWAVDVDVAAGERVAVVGPSGAGKSTLALVVAGLLALDDGTVTIGDRHVDSPAGFVPAGRRPVGLLEQRPLLFGHLDVLGNVAFGARAHGADPATAAARALAELERAGVAHLATRWPDELSGGEAARVALARTMAAGPAVVVLDEPLASLDADSAAAVRAALRDRLAGHTALVITHAADDVAALADRTIALPQRADSAAG